MENCSPLINESVDIPIITSLAVQSSCKCHSPTARFMPANNKCLMFVIWHFATTGVILKWSFIITFYFLSMQVTFIFTSVLQPVSVHVLCSLLSCICWFSNNVPRAFWRQMHWWISLLGKRHVQMTLWPCLTLPAMSVCATVYLLLRGVSGYSIQQTEKLWGYIVSAQVVEKPDLWQFNYRN